MSGRRGRALRGALLRAGAAALASPAVMGAIYVLALLAVARMRPIVGDHDEVLGADAHNVAEVVEVRFAGDVRRLTIAIAATGALVGAALGIAARALALWRERLGRRRPRGRLARAATTLGLVIALHAAWTLWAMARTPALFAEGWYLAGGARRTVQVIATDVLGPGGVLAVTIAALAFYVFDPPRLWRRYGGRLGGAAGGGGLARWTAALLAPIARRRRGDRGRRSAAPRQAVRRRAARRRAIRRGATAIAVLGAAGAAALALRAGATGDARARGGAAAGAGARRPNVLILAADSLRFDRLTPRTAPRLSELADRGTRFDRAYVSIPRTFPSWVTILTGRHAHHHGVRSMFARWEDRARDFDALPERLAGAGYQTAVISDYVGDIFTRIDLGFGEIDAPTFNFHELLRLRALERQTPLIPFFVSDVGRRAFPTMREHQSAADADLVADETIDALGRLGGAPFFLTVFFSTTHFPYAAKAPYYGRFTDPSYRGLYKYSKPVELGSSTSPPDDADVRQVRGLYDGAVASVDAAAGRVLDALERRGLADDTIVVVTADHGETLFEMGRLHGHGDHLFGDEGTHVPLVVFDPRRPGARRVDAIARDVDLAPTLYALTGVAPPADLDGRSLAPAIAGAALSPVLAYAETELWFNQPSGVPDDLRLPTTTLFWLAELDGAHGDEVVLRDEMRPLSIVQRHRMVRDERYKLIYAPTRGGVVYLLYDTIADPDEARDVAAEHPDVVARLKNDLWRWMLEDPSMRELHGYLVPRP